jgi:hypothetical protein
MVLTSKEKAGSALSAQKSSVLRMEVQLLNTILREDAGQEVRTEPGDQCTLWRGEFSA